MEMPAKNICHDKMPLKKPCHASNADQIALPNMLKTRDVTCSTSASKQRPR